MRVFLFYKTLFPYLYELVNMLAETVCSRGNIGIV